MNRHIAPVVIGLVTAAAMIAMAIYQRAGGKLMIPTLDFYLAAVVIVLLPTLIGSARHRLGTRPSCRPE